VRENEAEVIGCRRPDRNHGSRLCDQSELSGAAKVPLRLGRQGADMAESSPEMRERAPAAPNRGVRPIAVLAAVIMVSAMAPGAGLPEPPALTPERTRITRSRTLASTIAGLPARTLRWLIHLLLASPATRATPTSRSDTPALPTVGRPRDVPVA
jgi:hypothetical protein